MRPEAKDIVKMLKTYQTCSNVNQTAELTGYDPRTVTYYIKVNRLLPEERKGKYGGVRFSDNGGGTLRPEDRIRVLELYDQLEKNASRIAREIGRSVPAVSNVIRENRLKAKGKGGGRPRGARVDWANRSFYC
jgi:hypothetical protein